MIFAGSVTFAPAPATAARWAFIYRVLPICGHCGWTELSSENLRWQSAAALAWTLVD